MATQPGVAPAAFHEASVGKLMTHQNVIRIYKIERNAVHPFFVMEYFPSGSLRTRMMNKQVDFLKEHGAFDFSADGDGVGLHEFLGHQEQFRVEQVIDRVNTTAKVFLGLTLGCAQCHDHKYDPFTQRDYYRFFAFFNSDVEVNRPMPLPPATEEQRQNKAHRGAGPAAAPGPAPQDARADPRRLPAQGRRGAARHPGRAPPAGPRCQTDPARPGSLAGDARTTR